MAEQIRSAELLVRTALADPSVLNDLKTKPEDTLKKLGAQAIQQAPRPLDSDKWIYRIVVLALGIALLFVVIGAIVLAVRATGDVKIPDTLTALGSASVGALAGLLAPSPVRT